MVATYRLLAKISINILKLCPNRLSQEFAQAVLSFTVHYISLGAAGPSVSTHNILQYGGSPSIDILINYLMKKRRYALSYEILN